MGECDKTNCDDVHGLDGFNRLTQLIRPYKELRGFYFGVRAVLYRMCNPEGDDDTSYTQLRELEVNLDDDTLTVNYRPFRKEHFSLISYKGSLSCDTLAPLGSPVEGGEGQLRGYFNKNVFCAALCVFSNVVQALGAGATDFEARELQCEENYHGTLKREEARAPKDMVLKYQFYVKNDLNDKTLSEEISFIVNK